MKRLLDVGRRIGSEDGSSSCDLIAMRMGLDSVSSDDAEFYSTFSVDCQDVDVLEVSQDLLIELRWLSMRCDLFVGCT